MSKRLTCQTEPSRYAEGYQKLTITGTSFLDFRDIKELVHKYVKGKNTLDYGCGAGKSSRFLKSLGLSVTGADITEEMLKYARAADVDGTYELITSANVLVDDNTYDLVFSCRVMGQIPSKSELNKVGREIARILKPQGIFIMITSSEDRFNKDWLTVNTEFPENQKLYSGCNIKTRFKETNLITDGHFWTADDYKEMIESANMTILEVHKPLGKNSDGFNWNLETFVSPAVIYVAKKNE